MAKRAVFLSHLSTVSIHAAMPLLPKGNRAELWKQAILGHQAMCCLRSRHARNLS